MDDESAIHRRIRAGLVVLLLSGALFPPVGGVPIHLAASLLVAPMVAWEFLRPGPKSVFAYATAVVSIPLVASIFIPDPQTLYGAEKLQSLWTSTALSALSICLIRNERTLVTFAKTWVAIGVLLALITLVGAGGTGRSAAFGANPIWLARMLGTATVAAVWLGWQNTKLRPFLLTGTVVLASGVFVTGSRGPTLGMLIGLVFITLLAPSGRARKTILGLLVAILAGLFLTAIPSVQNSRIGSFAIALIASNEDADIGVRSEMWSRSIDLIQRSPAGVGYGNWASSAPAPGHHNYPHNLFLELAAEAGLLAGLLMLLIVCVTVVRLIVRSRTDAKVSLALALLVAELVAVSVSGDLNARTFFAMLTLGWVVSTWFPSRHSPS